MKIFNIDYSWKDFWIDILVTVVGTALVGVPLAIFTVPNDIAPGGVSGLATALAVLVPSLSVGTWTLLLNVPLMLGAWRLLGRRTLIFTLLSVPLMSFFIDFTGSLHIAYTNNMLIAAVFGGAISGFGLGLLFLRGITTGGTDLAALMLKRVLPNLPSGTLLLFIDASVVAFAVLVFKDIEVAIYSSIAIFVSSKTIDAITQGVDYAKVIYTITARGDEVVAALTAKTDRGTTVIPALGGYTRESKQIIVTVTRRRVLAQTLRVIKEADPAAFTFVTDSTEVHGEGFKAD
ncbi:MAG: YitT family protein [Oscillospiraceae bacterium]|nr:YitT family protein [Oscillospiraceae bacterium]